MPTGKNMSKTFMRAAFARARARFAKPILRPRFAALFLVMLFLGGAHTPPPGDEVSDRVGATKGTFAVDASGAATYSLPIYTTPGAAGLTPKIALVYNSQGGDGYIGRGWSLSGLSSISRCRGSREIGDYAADTGSPTEGGPITFSTTDKFCLDGQRLIPAPASIAHCDAVGSAFVTEFRTEVETFQRVCAYSWGTPQATTGPRFFTVEQGDGSTSWYGDRRANVGTPTAADTAAQGIVSRNGLLGDQADSILTWAQVRYQDTSGNYIDYAYTVHAGAQYPTKISYNGKNDIPGQAGTAHVPFAHIVFGYETNITKFPEFPSLTYVAGKPIQRFYALKGITVEDKGRFARSYDLTYGTTSPVMPVLRLQSIKECSEPVNKTICYPATTFEWSSATVKFDEIVPHTSSAAGDERKFDFGEGSRFDGFKLGDIDGDGLQDMVRLYDGTSSPCDTERIFVEFGSIDGAGRPTIGTSPQTYVCATSELSSLGAGSWFLFDYTGDGKDDLFMADTRMSNGTRMNPNGYVLYPSNGRPTSGTQAFNVTADQLPSGMLASKPTKADLAQLADFNGDGLLDVIYPSGTGHVARLMERNTEGKFGWIKSRTAILPTTCVATGPWSCKRTTPDVMKANSGYQLFDFNGDARSELVYRDERICSNCADEFYLLAYKVSSVSDSSISFGEYARWSEAYMTAEWTDNLRFTDINGDGLTDVLFQTTFNEVDVGDWYFQMNTGTGFASPQLFISATEHVSSSFVQIADVNQDGRADFLYGDYYVSGGLWVRYGRAAGGFAAKDNLWADQNLMPCISGLDCYTEVNLIFGDFDADGGIDALRLDWRAADDYMVVVRGEPVSRYRPREAIVAITDGLGSRTEWSYLPLSLDGIYRPDQNSRDTLRLGRDSPVFDVAAPIYAVETVRTEAPTASNPVGKRTRRYRYSGAKMQSGGRGFLGFEQVTSIDLAVPESPVATTTTYAQDFPFVGRPLITTVSVLDNPYDAGPCGVTGSSFAAGCFTNATGNFVAPEGAVVSLTTNTWTSPNFDPLIQAPIRVELKKTVSESYDLESAELLGVRTTDIEYDSWGNATKVTLSNSDAKPLKQVTTNTYLNDDAHWWLGRRLSSSVAFTRDGLTVTRETAYTFDTSRGLLVSEHIQPNGGIAQYLRTEYTLDAYGNRTGAYTCSQDIDPCITKAPVLNALTPTSIHRYSTQTYDADGRYVVSTSEPFRNPDPTLAWNLGYRVDAITQNVVSRDRFGNVTEATGLNGAVSTAAAGAMGRPYWTWSKSVDINANGNSAYGIDSYHTYRRCGAAQWEVACPSAATFREKVTVDGAATRWVYFDRLGRSVLAMSETLNQGVSGKDLAGTCTWYDGSGRVASVSNPFFLPGSFGGAEPTFSIEPCEVAVLEAKVGVTHSFYDVLGRPTRTWSVGIPEEGQVYDVESTFEYQGLITITRNDKGQQKQEARNQAGEVISSVDHLGTETQYEYDPTGNLKKVKRDAGDLRNPVQTTMTYDALGRKIGMVDPDAGSRIYAYNAAGNLISEQQGSTYWLKRYDFKGRMIWDAEKLDSASAFERSTIRNFDTAPNGKGLLGGTATTGKYRAWEVDDNLKIDHSVGHGYDTLGRRINTTTIVGNPTRTTYVESVVLDTLGRPFKVQDASTRWAKTEYSGRGFAIRICDMPDPTDSSPGCIATNGNTLRETLETDARGNPVVERRSGHAALVSTRKYHPFSGALLELCVGPTCTIVDEKYEWDEIGNLVSRDKNFQVSSPAYPSATGYKEEFAYDDINRLVESRFARIGQRGAGTQYVGTSRPFGAQLTYDRFGNICSRLTPSTGTPTTRTYNYGGAGGCGVSNLPGTSGTLTTISPHAVQSVSLNGVVETNYSYDITGNQETANRVADDTSDRTIRFTLRGDAHEIVRGTKAVRIWYDGEGGRYMRDDITYGGSTSITRTVTIGNVDFVSGSAGTYMRRNVGGVMYQLITGTTASNRYLHYDHLGSVVAVTASDGRVLERMDYAPFGERRGTNDPRIAGAVPVQTKRGFTGHETLDYTDVIHMNGRIYDPALARFLQVDPVIQDPSNGQNYNRYTYVWNNPLAYTDPTGLVSVENLAREIAGIYISAYMGNSSNVFGNQAGGTFANATGALAGSYVTGGGSGSGLSTAFSSSNQGNASEGGSSTSETEGTNRQAVVSESGSQQAAMAANAGYLMSSKDLSKVTFSGDDDGLVGRARDAFYSNVRDSLHFRGSVRIAVNRWGSVNFHMTRKAYESSTTNNNITIAVGDLDLFIGTVASMEQQKALVGLSPRLHQAGMVDARYEAVSVRRIIFHEILHPAFSDMGGLRYKLQSDDDKLIIPIENLMAERDKMFGGRQRTFHADVIFKEDRDAMLEDYPR